jgi:hypothetical protein
MLVHGSHSRSLALLRALCQLQIHHLEQLIVANAVTLIDFRFDVRAHVTATRALAGQIAFTRMQRSHPTGKLRRAASSGAGYPCLHGSTRVNQQEQVAGARLGPYG